MLKIKCPTCGKLLQGADTLRGTVQLCPGCRHFVEIASNAVPVQYHQGRPQPIPLKPPTPVRPNIVATPVINAARPPIVPAIPSPNWDFDEDDDDWYVDDVDDIDPRAYRQVLRDMQATEDRARSVANLMVVVWLIGPGFTFYLAAFSTQFGGAFGAIFQVVSFLLLFASVVFSVAISLSNFNPNR